MVVAWEPMRQQNALLVWPSDSDNIVLAFNKINNLKVHSKCTITTNICSKALKRIEIVLGSQLFHKGIASEESYIILEMHSL